MRQMGTNELIGGIDIGTSRCRGILWNLRGEVVAESCQNYPTFISSEGWYEHDPELIWQAFINVFKEVISALPIDSHAVIGLSAYLNSVILINEADTAVSNCILWTDYRATKELTETVAKVNSTELYKRTGCPLHPMFPIWKIKWFKRNNLQQLYKIKKFVSIKEYIIHKLCGEYIVDWSVASGSGLFNIHELQWDKTALEIAEVEEKQLSAPVSPLSVLPPLREGFQEILRGRRITFVIGGGDGPLSSIGAGAVDRKVADNTLGSGGAVRVVSNAPLLDDRGRTFCYALIPGKWVVGGVTPGGVVYDWFVRTWCASEVEEAKKEKKNIYETLEDKAKSVAPGSDGLIFLPFVAGAYCPSWRADKCGAFWGLRSHHSKNHLIRAVVEGLAYERYRAFKALEEVVGRISMSRLSGGFARSTLWAQIIADVLEVVQEVPLILETSAFGAALLAALACGLVETLEDTKSFVVVNKVVRPDMKNVKIYRQMLQLYQRLAELRLGVVEHGQSECIKN